MCDTFTRKKSGLSFLIVNVCVCVYACIEGAMGVECLRLVPHTGCAYENSSSIQLQHSCEKGSQLSRHTNGIERVTTF